MSNAAPWAATASNKFREAARSTDNPTTKLLAEGMTRSPKHFESWMTAWENSNSRCDQVSAREVLF